MPPCFSSCSSPTTSATELLGGRLEQLVTGERFEQLDDLLVVVRAGDQILGRDDLLELVVQQRRLGGRLHVRLRGEQPDQPCLADDLALGRDDAHAHVVHPRAPVHRAVGLRLRDDEELALLDPATHVRIERVQRRRVGERARGHVGEDPQTRVRDGLDRPPLGTVGHPVLAIAEEHEVQLQEPFDEIDRLADLRWGVDGRRLPRDLLHMMHALLHRLEVAHDETHIVQDRPDPPLEVAAVLLVEPAIQFEMHQRLAVRRVTAGHHPLQVTVLAANRADHRVHDQPHTEVPSRELLGDGVHQERRVVGVRLDDGAGHHVPVVVDRRHEDPHGGRMVAPSVDEREGRAHDAEQLLDPARRQILLAEPAKHHPGEHEKGVVAIGRCRGFDPLGKLDEQGVDLGGRLGRHGGVRHVRAPRCGRGQWFRLAWNPYETSS